MIGRFFSNISNVLITVSELCISGYEISETVSGWSEARV